jgi:hypothetical protein
MEYGDRIKIKKGVFEGCEGIFFNDVSEEELKKGEYLFKKRMLKMKNPVMIEIFFETPIMEGNPNTENYFEHMFNSPKKMTSIMIIISKEDLIKI